jgi:hypothetical protein
MREAFAPEAVVPAMLVLASAGRAQPHRAVRRCGVFGVLRGARTSR